MRARGGSTDRGQREPFPGLNDTRTDYPRDATIHKLFEQQVQLAPEATALTFEGEELSYADLNERANRVANHLSAMGVGSEQTVAVCLDRSMELIVGLLGILKSGAAYVPLDPNYPRRRLSFILDDTRATAVLLQERYVRAFREKGLSLVCLDADWGEISRRDPWNPGNNCCAESLAYVMYTSGSTGRPKGVCIMHRGVVRLVKNTNYISPGPGDVFLQLAPTTFDASTFEIWASLLNGARLAIMPPRPPSLADIGRAIRQHRVTTLWLTSAVFQEMVDNHMEDLRGLHQLITGGDVVPAAQARKLLRDLPGIKLINGYGPTESTTFACCYTMTDQADVGESVAIGKPISNTEVYLLDERMRPVGAGGRAELYIGGDGLARDYLNLPDMTAERFVPHPFSDEPGRRLYKTGDFGRLLPDGNIEFLGREDSQIKLRGLRVELAEIESVLRAHPAVRKAVVVAGEKTAGDKSLIAYVVAERDYGGPCDDTSQDRLREERVSHWRKIYDEMIYQRIDDFDEGAADPTFNITGWVSSYTGQPISHEEMREQVEQTVNRILSLRPESILEIGCGTGLLLFRIGPHCRRYWATDFSKAALDYIRRQLAGPDHRLPQVTLFQRSADDFQGIEPESFSGVVLNSIVQHFPDMNYLVRVLEAAIRAVKPGGFIYMGDVRSLPLLKHFYTSVQLHNARPSLPLDEFQQLVRAQVLKEEELLIDPAFFTELGRRFPQVGRVQVQLKRGRHHNELTRFRYDAIIRVGTGDALPLGNEWLDWQGQRLTLAELKEFLFKREPQVLGIRGVPNSRLAEEVKALEILESAGKPRTVAELREAAARQANGAAMDPEDFWGLSVSLPYDVEVRWSGPGHEGCFDVILRMDAAAQPSLSPQANIGAMAAPEPQWEEFGNRPLERVHAHRLRSELRSYVKDTLPDYMVPSAFIILDDLPLTPSGKLDRLALVDYQGERPESGQFYMAPRTPVEFLITEIWMEVLGVENVGINDNFFEVGGDSLKAVRVIDRIRRALGVELSLVSLFDKPTIGAMADGLRSGGDDSAWAERVASSLGRGALRRAKKMARVGRSGDDSQAQTPGAES